jgi:hypothetical protein
MLALFYVMLAHFYVMMYFDVFKKKKPAEFQLALPEL